jgi:hypothetical protein
MKKDGKKAGDMVLLICWAAMALWFVRHIGFAPSISL